jgi:hypothetical protein
MHHRPGYKETRLVERAAPLGAPGDLRHAGPHEKHRRREQQRQKAPHARAEAAAAPGPQRSCPRQTHRPWPRASLGRRGWSIGHGVTLLGVDKEEIGGAGRKRCELRLVLQRPFLCFKATRPRAGTGPLYPPRHGTHTQSARSLATSLCTTPPRRTTHTSISSSSHHTELIHAHLLGWSGRAHSAPYHAQKKPACSKVKSLSPLQLPPCARGCSCRGTCCS